MGGEEISTQPSLGTVKFERRNSASESNIHVRSCACVESESGKFECAKGVIGERPGMEIQNGGCQFLFANLG